MTIQNPLPLLSQFSHLSCHTCNLFCHAALLFSRSLVTQALSSRSLLSHLAAPSLMPAASLIASILLRLLPLSSHLSHRAATSSLGALWSLSLRLLLSWLQISRCACHLLSHHAASLVMLPLLLRLRLSHWASSLAGFLSLRSSPLLLCCLSHRTRWLLCFVASLVMQPPLLPCLLFIT